MKDIESLEVQENELLSRQHEQLTNASSILSAEIERQKTNIENVKLFLVESEDVKNNVPVAVAVTEPAAEAPLPHKPSIALSDRSASNVHLGQDLVVDTQLSVLDDRISEDIMDLSEETYVKRTQLYYF